MWLERCRGGSYAVNALRCDVWVVSACTAVCIVACLISGGAFGGSVYTALAIVVHCIGIYQRLPCISNSLGSSIPNDPSLGDVLRLEREYTNCKDRFAVAVINGSIVVGHLPYNIASTAVHFLIIQGVRYEGLNCIPM